ncbi:MAG: HNH endonuclease signature motif containing protein, partial [Nitrososphaeraceae archaeon]|nr:HNH endonuclease signature motif containing protein [Nitrososphaeraceae archaeon]
MNLIKYEPATGNHRQIFKSFHNLTEEDIRGLHIHHLIHRSNGGGDYWWNLVAYTPELHSYV